MSIIFFGALLFVSNRREIYELTLEVRVAYILTFGFQRKIKV